MSGVGNGRSPYTVYLWGAFLFYTSLPNLSTFLPFLIMSSATTSGNSGNNTTHPLESFHSSMDYHHFETSVICPFFLQAKICDSLNSHHHTSLSFALAPGHPSLNGLITFLANTDYNQITPSKPLPSLPQSDVSTSQVEGTPDEYTQTILFGSMDTLKKDQLYSWGAALDWQRFWEFVE